jgi:hypothetical protein
MATRFQEVVQVFREEANARVKVEEIAAFVPF